MKTRIVAEFIEENELANPFDEDDQPYIWNEIDLGFASDLNGYIEFDKTTYQNVRTSLGLVLELITDSDQVLPHYYPPRTRHEINGAYKIAKARGARLYEVEVFNLYFRFVSHLRGDGIALMYRPAPGQKERIILLPDDTRQRIDMERQKYLEEARDLVILGLMNPDHQSILIENLRMLNIHERCAQSLQHEFGHVLHWREFDILGIQFPPDIYNWFVETGYYDIVDRRVPNFGMFNASDKLLILKESLVEDYRIALNLASKSGTFILPNKFCFSGDFQNPELLFEGVTVMTKMLTNQIHHNNRREFGSSDFDSLQAFKMIQDSRRRAKWVAGERTATRAVIEDDLLSLRQQFNATTLIDR